MHQYPHCTGINVNIQDKYGNTALIRALEKVLYKDKNEVGRDIAQQLIAAQAQVDIKNNDENAPLVIAVKNKDLAMVNDLLEHGACLETFDAHMKTALFWAAEKGYEDIFDVLLEHGAKVNEVSNPKENTPLMAALINSHLDIAQKILSQKGVTIRQKNQKGETLIHLAANDYESLKTILALHPENKRLEAVMIQNKDGKPMLDSIVHDPKNLKTILALLPTEIHYSNKNKEQTVLSSNIDILRISQISPSFFSTAKENNSDKASKKETDLDPDILKILEKEKIYEECLLSLGKEKLG
ncbi:ankyrin repeat domain-containing protein [Legionella sainthelensi]|uniref:ankyrin repeat domain-containing protein n=1 Tax=Legionella sainthelensi TaxID=28087 RepID=UPI000E2032E3|nr:ankyrin repeat domain-containing protein [Legionella sainthelensi]